MTKKAINGRTMEAIEAALPKEIGDDLNARQAEFVKQYLVDLNATKAAIRAGYSPHTAKEIGYQNLQKPRVAKAIHAALAEFGGITRTRLLDELGAIAFSDIGEVVDWTNTLEHAGTDLGVHRGPNGGRQEIMHSRVMIRDKSQIDELARRAISKVVMTDKGALRIEMHDKIAALKVLGQALGMFKEQLDVTSAGAAVLPAVIHYYGRPEPQRKGSEPAGRPSVSRAVKPARDKGS
jgi:phage terminase small subunit